MLNQDKFKTVEERVEAYLKYKRLDYGTMGHALAFDYFGWLALEAEDEKPEPCPFCGGECVCAKEWNSKFRVVCHERDNCWYSSSLYDTRDAAIAAHNRVARDVRAAKEEK